MMLNAASSRLKRLRSDFDVVMVISLKHNEIGTEKVTLNYRHLNNIEKLNKYNSQALVY